MRHGFAPCFVNYKKGALDSQPQVIEFTMCLHRVGGSLQLLPPIKLVAMILLKVALNTINQSINQLRVQQKQTKLNVGICSLLYGLIHKYNGITATYLPFLCFFSL